MKRRTDIQRWGTTAVALTCLVYSSLLIVLLSALTPGCWCAHAYAHVTAFPLPVTLGYLLALGHCAAAVAASGLVIVGMGRRERSAALHPLIAINVCTEIAILLLTGAVFYLISLDVEERYGEAIVDSVERFVLKEEVRVKLDHFLDSIQGFVEILTDDLGMEGEGLDADKLMQLSMKPKVYLLTHALMNAAKVCLVLGLALLNTLFVFATVLACLHRRRSLSRARRKRLKSSIGMSEVRIDHDRLLVTVDRDREGRRRDASLSTHATTMRCSSEL